MNKRTFKSLFEKDKSDFYYPESHQKIVYQIFKDITNLLEKNEITYFLVFGTLLGAVRHGKMIPWDEDTDIGVFNDDVSKILALRTEIEKLGYIFYAGYGLLKVSKKEGGFINQNSCYVMPTLDIWVYEVENDEVKLMCPFLFDQFPNSKWKLNEFYPLSKCKFDDAYYPCSKDNISYLNRQYPEWDKKAKIDIIQKNGLKHRGKYVFDLN